MIQINGVNYPSEMIETANDVVIDTPYLDAGLKALLIGNAPVSGKLYVDDLKNGTMQLFEMNGKNRVNQRFVKTGLGGFKGGMLVSGNGPIVAPHVTTPAEQAAADQTQYISTHDTNILTDAANSVKTAITDAGQNIAHTATDAATSVKNAAQDVSNKVNKAKNALYLKLLNLFKPAMVACISPYRKVSVNDSTNKLARLMYFGIMQHKESLDDATPAPATTAAASGAAESAMASGVGEAAASEGVPIPPAMIQPIIHEIIQFLTGIFNKKKAGLNLTPAEQKIADAMQNIVSTKGDEILKTTDDIANTDTKGDTGAISSHGITGKEIAVFAGLLVAVYFLFIKK